MTLTMKSIPDVSQGVCINPPTDSAVHDSSVWPWHHRLEPNAVPHARAQHFSSLVSHSLRYGNSTDSPRLEERTHR